MTRVHLHPGGRLDLASGALVPRVLSRAPGAARVALVGARALLVAGDDVHLDVAVGAGCALELVEVAGTVAFDQRGGPPASWRVRARLGSGARLTWHGEPFVVADGASVERSTDVELAEGAVALLRETLVLGRTGERGGALLSRTRAHLDGRPLLAEDLDLREPAVRTSPAVLGTARCVDSVTLLGARPAGDEPDALHLQGPGALARTLTADAHTSDLGGVWSRWSAQPAPVRR
ncbi:urease accessory protein UreD [Paenibacillus sp. TRM 82003]|uniref:urease accessory protein UreD n=1 Tax=Kineococcus sp. TRM81007 TaxID=2925831 RepID=UPI001F55BBBF|nr:urease accessory protein UreD [Kineococcus sp. TRM81007]MCI2239228.1 urease accessory protein UreD [Kineococcus sp. TRM81007]MCI3924910.1 urease accessory protein UreD [Paenibacillus sp. TRM 82003]